MLTRLRVQGFKHLGRSGFAAGSVGPSSSRGAEQECLETCYPHTFRSWGRSLVLGLLLEDITMTELRRRMIEDMQLAGLSQGTQEAYVRAAQRLAARSASSVNYFSPPATIRFPWSHVPLISVLRARDHVVSAGSSGLFLSGFRRFARPVVGAAGSGSASSGIRFWACSNR